MVENRVVVFLKLFFYIKMYQIKKKKKKWVGSTKTSNWN